MVTKIYCDHCGHMAHNAKKFVYGSHNHFYGGQEAAPMPATTGLCSSPSQQAIAQAQAAQNYSGYQVLNAPKVIERPQFGSVDLCDTCQIVWMNRVKALTQASEP
jgi:hypothetical protein